MRGHFGLPNSCFKTSQGGSRSDRVSKAVPFDGGTIREGALTRCEPTSVKVQTFELCKRRHVLLQPLNSEQCMGLGALPLYCPQELV